MKGLQNIMNEQEEAMDLLLKKSKYYDNSKNLSKEIATIKTQLLFLVSRLDRILELGIYCKLPKKGALQAAMRFFQNTESMAAVVSVKK